MNNPFHIVLVQEPAIFLIKWVRPKGLKVCSYVEKYADFKNQTLKKIDWYTKMLFATEYPRGMQFLKSALKWGTLCQIIGFDIPCIPRTICIGVKLFRGTQWTRKQFF